MFKETYSIGILTVEWEPPSMSKTDTFFIRATLDCQNVNPGPANTFNQIPIDLGTYVNALEKSVLRIKSIQVAFSDGYGTSSTIIATSVGVCQYQLTTQSQDASVLASNNSVIGSGRVHLTNQLAANGLATIVSDMNDLAPNNFGTDGYLVAVDTIFLGGQASTGFVGDAHVSVILECQVETLTTSKAMALALSQQGA